ncbi:hypothetical protein AB0K00_51090, partial [Dactylosporangium sp. NPDC049525]|uniref:hypothetical protein n=1 Tax=Dactylosporangium sp. NPDC049525 TaxID=3154730 RepID=UPI003415C523
MTARLAAQTTRETRAARPGQRLVRLGTDSAARSAQTARCGYAWRGRTDMARLVRRGRHGYVRRGRNDTAR